MQLLIKDRIFNGLPTHIRSHILKADLLDVVASTNTYLMQRYDPREGGGHLCIAEQQTAGKGRLGRKWFSPYGKNIYLSYATRMKYPISELGGLSLMVGVQIAKCLLRLGLADVQLKWPNDVFLKGRKVAGVLIEIMDSPSEGVTPVVIGVGLNVNMKEAVADIEVPWSSVVSYSDRFGWSDHLCAISLQDSHERMVDRNELVKLLIADIIEGITSFNREGFLKFRQEWVGLDYFMSKSIACISAQENIVGIGRGIDSTGRYLIEVDGGIRSLISGEIRIRSAV